ncbi:hypothetical protein [Chryseobacterium gambrini]|uniref:hypothetical protein n=1 Tax=Chryseobacterium gambrini TaxID=373672 RepID=UPI0022F40651|nr:hypothetical protein [Chryseobacterium gambrini]WBX99041.1 hypothetical protein PE065_07245 [Chryseobacterium gambrini]
MNYISVGYFPALFVFEGYFFAVQDFVLCLKVFLSIIYTTHFHPSPDCRENPGMERRSEAEPRNEELQRKAG